MPEPYRARSWWLPLLLITSVPGLLLAYVVALLGKGQEWRYLWSEGGFFVHVALIPFYVACVTVGLHRRRLRADSHSAINAVADTRLPLWIVAPAASACVVVAILMIHFSIADHFAIAARHDLRVAAPCSNRIRQTSDVVGSGYRVVVFDLYCDPAPWHTVNVSIVAPGTPIVGRGNVFVAEEIASSAGGTPDGVSTFALPQGPSHLLVTYAPTTRVIARRDKLGEITIDFMPDTISR